MLTNRIITEPSPSSLPTRRISNPYKMSYLYPPSNPLSPSVTPITPMTPLTTPKTPAQALLGRDPRLPLEPPQEKLRRQRLALQILTDFVDSAEASLREISEEAVGPGIVRMCMDLAGRADESARGMESELVVRDVLLDAAETLRSISEEEARELGEVALRVAHTVVKSLRVIQVNMTKMIQPNEVGVWRMGEEERLSREVKMGVVAHEAGGNSGRSEMRVTWATDSSSHDGLAPLVEILGEEEKKDDNGLVVGTPPKNSPPRYASQLSPIPSSPMRTSPPRSIHNFDNHAIPHQPKRRRVLWPPLLPALQDAAHHCVHSAQDHPLPALALGLSCGPAVITTAILLGPPLLAADWAIQSSYNALHDTAFVDTMERGAEDVFQMGRLSILTGKLLVGQGLSIGQRQIQRRGGVGRVCHDIVDEAADMALHPVDTMGKAWNGMFWMGGLLGNAVGIVRENVGGGKDVRIEIMP